MAAYTSSQAGNWSSSATWGGAGVPADGDTAAFTHAITVDVNTTMGSSPADLTTFVLDGNTGGSITIATGVTFNVQGNIRLPAGNFTLEAASTFNFDFTDAAATAYVCQMGRANGNAVKILCNGVNGQRCTIGRIGSGRGYFTSFSATLTYCSMDAAYTDLSQLHRVSNGRAFEYDNGVNHGVTASVLRFSHCTVRNCGSFYAVGSLQPANTFSILDTAFTEPLDTTNGFLRAPAANSPLTTGTREILRSSLNTGGAAPAAILGEAYLTVEDSLLCGKNGIQFAFLSGAWTSFKNNLVILRNGLAGSGTIDPMNIRGPLEAWNYVLADGTGGNPHILTSTIDALTVDGLIFEYPFQNITDGGDGFLSDAAGADLSKVATLTRCIVLPSQYDGYMACCLANFGAAWAVSFEHCTLHLGNQGGGAIGDYGTVTGSYTSIKSNIGFIRNGDPTGALGPLWLFSAHNSSNPTGDPIDCCAGADAGYNAGWNLLTGYSRATQHVGLSGKGYQTNTTDPIGTTDIDLGSGGTGPGFVNVNVNIGSWAVTRGSVSGTYAGKIADALTYIDADATLISTSLIPHILAGFAPTNAVLEDAGHDSVTIGALPMAEVPDLSGPIVGGRLVSHDGGPLVGGRLVLA